ncbi:40S ribosomal protein S3a, partial [Galemys pyrenaicus]
ISNVQYENYWENTSHENSRNQNCIYSPKCHVCEESPANLQNDEAWIVSDRKCAPFSKNDQPRWALTLISRLQIVVCFAILCWFYLKKCNSQIQKTSYAQNQQIRQTNDLKKVVNKWIPESTGKDREKDLSIKVKTLKNPKFELGKFMELHGKGRSSGKAMGMRQVLNVNELVDMSH